MLAKLRALIRKKSFFSKLYDECDDLVFVFKYETDSEAKQRAEDRYKVVVATILPILLSRVRAIFFILAFAFGLLLGGAILR